MKLAFGVAFVGLFLGAYCVGWHQGYAAGYFKGLRVSDAIEKRLAVDEVGQTWLLPRDGERVYEILER